MQKVLSLLGMIPYFSWYFTADHESFLSTLVGYSTIKWELFVITAS